MGLPGLAHRLRRLEILAVHLLDDPRVGTKSVFVDPEVGLLILVLFVPASDIVNHAGHSTHEEPCDGRVVGNNGRSMTPGTGKNAASARSATFRYDSNR